MDTSETWLDFYYETRFAHLRGLYADGGTFPPVPIPLGTRALSEAERAELDCVLSQGLPPRRPAFVARPKGTALYHIEPCADGKLPADRPVWTAPNVADLDILWAFFEAAGIAEARHAFEYELQADAKLIRLDAEYSFTDLERYIRSLDETYAPAFGFGGRGDNHVAAQWLQGRAGRVQALSAQGLRAEGELELAQACGWSDFLSFPVQCMVHEVMLTAPAATKLQLRRKLGGRPVLPAPPQPLRCKAE